MAEFAVHGITSTGKKLEPIFVEAANILEAWKAAQKKSPILKEEVWGSIEQLRETNPSEYPLKSTTEMAWEFKSARDQLFLTPYEGYKNKMVGHCCRCFKFGVVTKEIDWATLGAEISPRIPLCGPCKANDKRYDTVV